MDTQVRLLFPLLRRLHPDSLVGGDGACDASTAISAHLLPLRLGTLHQLARGVEVGVCGNDLSPSRNDILAAGGPRPGQTSLPSATVRSHRGASAAFSPLGSLWSWFHPEPVATTKGAVNTDIRDAYTSLRSARTVVFRVR